VHQNTVPPIHEIYLTFDHEDQVGNDCKNMQALINDCNDSYNRFCGKCDNPGGVDECMRFWGLLYKIIQTYLYMGVGVVRKLTPMIH